ncbi:MAG: tetratricopeptide repeat protein [Candidatus Omnitrophica bacterium]|nr:tetratricopeptide repeat protein [Candidatus Omnitrophota bacterium]
MAQKRHFFRLILGIAVISAMAYPSYASDKAVYEHNQEGRKYLEQGKFREAINEFKEADSYSPGNKVVRNNLMVAYNNYGIKLRDEGDLSGAIDQLESAVAYKSDSAYPYYSLGQTYYMMQNMPKAAENLEQAYRINPNIRGLRELRDKAGKEHGVENDFHKFDTMHFIVTYSDLTSIEKVTYIRTYLEEAYGQVGMYLDRYPEQRTNVLIYTPEEYKELVGARPTWSMAVFDGKIRIPEANFEYTNEKVARALYHEYAHALVLSISGGRCPNWFSEGIASKAEDLVTVRDKELIGKYVKKFGLVPVRNMPDKLGSIKDVHKATLMYIQAYLVVSFIQERKGQSGIREILKELGEGKGLIRSIEDLFSEDIAAFDQKFKLYVIDEYRIDT